MFFNSGEGNDGTCNKRKLTKGKSPIVVIKTKEGGEIQAITENDVWFRFDFTLSMVF